MPHFILGITKTKFIGSFGFSPAGNIVNAVIQFMISLVLIHIQYGLATIFKNGMLMASILIMVIFLFLKKQYCVFITEILPASINVK